MAAGPNPPSLPISILTCEELNMNRLTRRDVLKGAIAASTVFPLFTVAGTRASGKVLGANETIRVGVAGINGRGRSHIEEFLGMDQSAGGLPDRPRQRLFAAAARVSRRRRQHAEVRAGHPRRPWRTRTWTPSPWPPATTGTR